MYTNVGKESCFSPTLVQTFKPIGVLRHLVEYDTYTTYVCNFVNLMFEQNICVPVVPKKPLDPKQRRLTSIQ
jgi:hypothetical protein